MRSFCAHRVQNTRNTNTNVHVHGRPGVELTTIGCFVGLECVHMQLQIFLNNAIATDQFVRWKTNYFSASELQLHVLKSCLQKYLPVMTQLPQTELAKSRQHRRILCGGGREKCRENLSIYFIFH